MRKNSYSPAKPFFVPASKRRRVDTGPARSPQNRPGFIDQKLIEGSQQPRSSNSISRESSPPLDPLSSLRDEDPQFDAFDLGLLAEESELGSLHTRHIPSAQMTPPRGAFAPNARLENAPPQRSRFFNPSSNVIPLHELRSSQLEGREDPPSSPLALLHQRKQDFWAGKNQHEQSRNSIQYQSSQASPQVSLSSHVSTEISKNTRPGQGHSPFGNIPLSVRGIVLVSVEELPESYRALFTFPLFNAIQSKCFHTVYNTNDNLVLSAPTGSGKTVVMELAICRLIKQLKDERFKVVYQAPTKSLCAERFRDWSPKFASLDLKCAELTGDTDHNQLRSVQSGQIIITTPEKWDGMTRKWKDHMRLMQLVKLFLIDEVHILKESRGATLEAVVSRMKNIGSNVRFVALSATVPNSEDIATWLGKDATNQHVPAHREHFGEDFRPVKLQKFVYGYQSTANDFAFDKFCGTKLAFPKSLTTDYTDKVIDRLPDVIGMHANQKPLMIFCCTRNSAVATAKELARQWTMTNPPARLWRGPGRRIEVHNEDLEKTISAGVAFHHAGLGAGDRHTVEKYFLDGHINVICCTSTLAVGVNLPCHLVIIKNTVGWQEGGCKEYSDLEMMQMLGRAGRPQFDDSATAVILTRKERVAHYERLVSGSESLESCLHLNLIDHLNAEIGLGFVSDVESATKWLAGTFLFVRLRRNPTHYKLKEGASQEDEDALLRQICEKDIKLLQECDLVEKGLLLSTQFGDAMARYYIRFETMKKLLSLKSQATISQILDVIIQAEEFKEIRLKAGEKSLYKEINRDPSIRFPIKVDIALPAHKISLLLQSELGAIDFPGDDQYQKHKFTFQQDKNLVFMHVNRLIRCVIDCLIAREDSIAILNALELARSFGAKVWDQSPLQMKQIEQVGVVAVRKLAAAGITGLEALEDTEPHRIEMALSKNPPFGTKLLDRLKEFPKLRVAVKMVGKDAKPGNVQIRFKFEVAFMNDNTPVYFQRRPVYVCCLAETSTGRLIDFRRISASKLQQGLEPILTAEMRSPTESIICHAMCDNIAGTARQAEFKPDVSSSLFSSKRVVDNSKQTVDGQHMDPLQASAVTAKETKRKTRRELDVFDGDDLELGDFLIATQRNEKAEFPPTNNQFQFDEADWLSIDSTPSPHRPNSESQRKTGSEWATDMGPREEDEQDEPVRLANGNWACNHKCKNKTICKHFCCRDGLEKPPKPGKKRAVPNARASGLSQLTLAASINKQPASTSTTTSTQVAKAKAPTKRQNSNLSTDGTAKGQAKRTASSQSLFGNATIKKPNVSNPETAKVPVSKTPSSDFGDEDLDELPSPDWLFRKTKSSIAVPETPLADLLRSTEPEPVCVDPSKLSIEQPIQVDAHQVSTNVIHLPETGPTAVPSAAHTSQPFGTAKVQQDNDIWNDFSYDSGDEIFTNPGHGASSAITGPFAPSTANRSRDSKPKADAPEEALDEKASKKMYEYSSHDTFQERIATGSESTLRNREDHSPMEVDDDESSTGWEDPDRCLLEEFKHIINFY